MTSSNKNTKKKVSIKQEGESSRIQLLEGETETLKDDVKKFLSIITVQTEQLARQEKILNEMRDERNAKANNRVAICWRKYSMRAALLLCALVAPALAYTERGILKLDNTTFDRIIDGTRGVFVRFDKEYSYGDDHDAWKDYAKTVGQSAADLLSCDVGVSEYGDKDNSDLAERFGIKTDDFPQFRLWKKGSSSADDPIKYDGPKKSADFLRFVQEKANAWIGLPGQVKELDELAKELVGGADAATVIAKAEKAAAESDEETAKYYVKAMQKLSKDKEFIAKETTRLNKMLDDGSVKASKKEQFGRRLNVLNSFS